MVFYRANHYYCDLRHHSVLNHCLMMEMEKTDAVEVTMVLYDLEHSPEWQAVVFDRSVVGNLFPLVEIADGYLFDEHPVSCVLLVPMHEHYYPPAADVPNRLDVLIEPRRLGDENCFVHLMNSDSAVRYPAPFLNSPPQVN